MIEANFSLAILGILATTILAIYWYVAQIRYNFWSKRGINGPKPSLFRLGNMLTRISTSPALDIDWQRKHGKVYGYYSGVEPILTVCDHEMIKQIMVRDFGQFVNRRLFAVDHPTWNSNLFVLDDKNWKRVRSITSPAFSIGKLHAMFPLMDRSVQKFIDYLDKLTAESEQNSVQVTPNELVSGLLVDIIASTSFGTETNANTFGTKQAATNPIIANAMIFNLPNSLQLVAFFIFPKWINRLLNIGHFFNKESFDYFQQLIKQVVGQRRLNGGAIRRNDFVQLLLDARMDEDELNSTKYDQLTATSDQQQTQDKLETDNNSTQSPLKTSSKTKLGLTENEIISQGMGFFAGGFEGSYPAFTFCLYELSVNPDIQERLFQELEQIYEEVDREGEQQEQKNKIYNKIMSDIPYLDAVIKETLRKYPPAARVERRVGVDKYRLGNVELTKDQLIEVSTYAVHRNPEYFPEPERFDPERFMPENRERLVPYTYLPFGVGPRNCIGMRFAYQEMKLILVRLLHQFRLEATKDTPIPVQFVENMQVVTPKPFPIRISRR